MIRQQLGRSWLLLLGLLLAFSSVVTATELVVWDWMQSRHGILKTYAEQYQRLHPEIRFQLQTVALAQYPDKLTASMAAGVPPDLLYLHNKFTSQFVQFLEPFPEELFPLAQMRQEYIAFDQGHLMRPTDQRFYFHPGGIMTGVVFYNKDLWAASGLAQTPKTWDELRLSGRKLLRKSSDGLVQQVGLDLRGAVWTILTDMVYQQGSWLFSADGSQAILDTPECLRALRYFGDILFTDGNADIPAGASFDITRGNVGLQYKWAWHRENLDKVTDLRYGVFAIPTFTGSMAPALGRNNYEPSFSVPKGLDDAQRTTAFAFLHWLYEGDDYELTINVSNGKVPGKMRLWRDARVRQDPVESVLAAMAPYTVFPGELPNYQWEQPMSDMAGKFLKRTNSPEALLADAQRVMNARLAEQPAAWVVERRYRTPK